MSRLVLGTWEFALKNCSEEVTRYVISYAIDRGIQWFDTAEVYGGGLHETILGDYSQAKVITKIPAIHKPSESGFPISSYYTRDYINKCCELSCSRLKREPNILLLHNWTDDWNDCDEFFEWMCSLKQAGKCEYIGISLPDTYHGRPIKYPFDWIMAPLNCNAKWIHEHYSEKMPDTKLCIRSLFRRGKDIPPTEAERQLLIKNADFADKIVIGMTSTNTIDENIRLMGELF